MQITIDLIAMQVKQLKRQNEDLKEVKNMFQKLQRQEKKIFDLIYEIRNEELKNEDLILLHDIQHMHDQNFNTKLKYK